MKKHRSLRIILLLFLTSCSSVSGIAATETPQPTNTVQLPTATVQPTFTPTPDYPPEGLGPQGFPEDVNPLTGLQVENIDELQERSVAIKVENLPRGHRPQSGLSAADLVYEYYTEFGTTRFIAIYHAQTPERVGPIRSARFFDVHVVQSYNSVFLFGGAYTAVFNRILGSSIASRLVLEGPSSYPALYRQEVDGDNLLFANLTQLPEALTKLGIDDQPQDLSGMYFKKNMDVSGYPAEQITVRYSYAIFNQWRYDAQASTYLRWVDEYAVSSVADETYIPLVDRETGEQIEAENLVVLFAPNNYYVKNDTEEVIDINLLGSGDALFARDGQIFPVFWERKTANSMLTIVDADGNPFPFKPGNTWFEVVGLASQQIQDGENWRINHQMP